MARTSTPGKPAATAPDRASKTSRLPAPISATDVARRAYDFYLARGREHGHDVDDWMKAERELADTLKQVK